MRTAEEILAQTLAEDYKKDMGEELPFGYNDYRKKTIISSMEEYAKEVAADFVRWKRLNDRQGGDAVYKMRGLTPEQLFDLYQQEKSSLK